MSYPIVDLTFWNPGDPGTPEIDALLADPNTPLAKHGLTGIASAYAEETGALLHEVHQWWANELAMRSLAADGAISEIVAVLRGAGCDFFIAKGPTIAYTRYPRPTMRPYADLDVYVKPKDHPAATRGLRRCAYRKVPQTDGVLGGTGCEFHGGAYGAVIELHASPADNLHRHYLPGLDVYFDAVHESPLLGQPVPQLSAAASLALELVHFAACHRYARLVLLRDLAPLVANLEPESVERYGVAAYHRVASGIAASVRDGDVSSRSKLAHLLAAGDPIRWNEYDASVRNLVSLVAQPGARHVAAATAAAMRATIPRRGRRAQLRWHRRSTRQHAGTHA